MEAMICAVVCLFHTDVATTAVIDQWNAPR